MAFTPFFQGTDAQNLITNYLSKNITADTPMEAEDMNQHGVFRNPYSPEGFYANETDMYPVEAYKPPVEDEDGVPSCEEGYVYDSTLKSCVFVGYGKDSQQSSDDRDDPEERPYMSIEDMQNASNKELLDYLKSGWLKNSLLGYLPSKGGKVTLGGNFMPPAFGLAFGGQNDLRRNAIIAELSNRGYFTGEFDDKGQEIFDIVSTPNPNIGFNEAEVPYGGSGIINEGVTGSYGGGEDFGSPFQGGGGNVVINTPNPHLNTGTPVSYASLNPNDGILYTAPSNHPHGNIGQQVKKLREKTGYNSNPNNLMFGK